MNPIKNRSDHNRTEPTGKLKSHPEAWAEFHTTARAANVRAASEKHPWHTHATKVMTTLALLMVAGIAAVVAVLPVALLEFVSLLIRKVPLEPWLVAVSWASSLLIVVLWMARGRSR